MYINIDSLKIALNELAPLHPFYGITFLACKANNLPVGKAIEFPINAIETEFLSYYYKPLKNTEKFFRVFRKSEKNKYWLNSDYASSGSQATRTQNFADVFIHPKASNLWGWDDNYINTLASHLKGEKLPSCSLALWLLRDFEWDDDSSLDTVLSTFKQIFKIKDDEYLKLFDTQKPKSLNIDVFSEQPYDWNKLSDSLKIPAPPDLPIEKGGALLTLTLENIEPYIQFELNLSKRLNIITGDNGLGKSFLLECAWWALTGTWTSFPIYPKNDRGSSSPQIAFEIAAASDRKESFIAKYNWRQQRWLLDNIDRKTVAGLVIYAQVDGAFAIWDPARIAVDENRHTESLPSTYIFSREDIWEGMRVGEGSRSRAIFNGLITDWVHWQNSSPEAFDILKRVLKRLSPPDLKHGDLGILEPGEIVRIPGESRPIPTIKHPYGDVPIIFTSAAVKRIIALAYLIVWTWEEHKTSAKLMREPPQSKMVVIADEIESHLHPQWQRVILPALTSISADLSNDLDIQFIITTHSPLVMASIEPIFDNNLDSIFHLNLQIEGDEANVRLENIEFQKRGSADSWLVSDIFDLRQPRSVEAETAIEQAKILQTEPKPSKQEIIDVSAKLAKFLPPHDTFWIRWNYFAEKYGVQI